MNLYELKDTALDLLSSAGFCSELFYIKMKTDSVEVHFDHPGAVDYFRKEVESSIYAKDIIFGYRKEGVRHVAYLQYW
jgi:hypothetical protein